MPVQGRGQQYLWQNAAVSILFILQLVGEGEWNRQKKDAGQAAHNFTWRRRKEKDWWKDRSWGRNTKLKNIIESAFAIFFSSNVMKVNSSLTEFVTDWYSIQPIIQTSTLTSNPVRVITVIVYFHETVFLTCNICYNVKF